MYKMLLSQKDFIKEPIEDFCKELVSIPSVSLNESKVAKSIEKKMCEFGYDKVFTDEFGNVVGIIFGKDPSQSVILNSHMDTIMPENETKGHYDPYSGKTENGKIFGLGSSDCKGGITAQIFAGAMLKQSMLPLKGNLVVVASVAEENGRSVGIKSFVEKTLPSIGLNPSYMILGEPTGLGLYYGHDGWAEIEVSVEGANPYHVEDAAELIYNDLRSMYMQNSYDTAKYIDVAKPFFIENKGIKKAMIQVDKRILQDESIDGVIYELKHNASLLAQNSGAVAVDVDVCQENQRMYTGHVLPVKHITHAWSTDPYHPIMSRARQALSAAGCDVRTGKWQLNRLGMGTAGSAMVNEFKIPTIGYGPGIEEVSHTKDEYVEIAKINEAVYGTAAIVHGLIGIPVFGWTSDEI